MNTSNQLQIKLPHPLYCQINFIFENELYFFGGLTTGHQFKNELIKYSLLKKQWYNLKYNGKTTQRIGMEYQEQKGVVYFIGGQTNRKQDCLFLNDYLTLDIKKMQFRKNSQPFEGRIGHSLSLCKDSLIMYGGCNNKKIFNDVWQFNFDNKKWRILTFENSNKPEFRFGHTTATINNLIIIFGGSSGQKLLNNIVTFNPYSLQWQQINNDLQISLPLFQQLTILDNQTIFLFGGINQQNVNNTHYFFLYDLQFSKLFQISQEQFNLEKRSFHQVIIYLFILAKTLYQMQCYNNNQLFIIGGIKDNNEIFDNMINIQFSYDLIQSLKNNNNNNSSNIISKQFDDQMSYSSLQFNENHNNNYIQIDQIFEWKQLNPGGQLFSPRTGHLCIIIKDEIFIFGGADMEYLNNDIYIYQININNCYKLTNVNGDIPQSRSGAKGVELDDSIYIFGGYKTDEFFDNFYKFDPNSNTWTLIKLQGDVIEGRKDHVMVKFQHYIYIQGGQNQSKYILNDIYRINTKKLASKKIQQEGEMPVGRFGHSGNEYQNQLVIFGGWNGQQTLNELYLFSFVSNTWYEEKFVCGTKPQGRYRHSATIIKNCLYLFGGIDKNKVKFDDLYQYSFKKREWALIESVGSIPSARTFHQLVSYDDYIFVVGGNDWQKRNYIHSMKIQEFQYFNQQDFAETESQHFNYFDSEAIQYFLQLIIIIQTKQQLYDQDRNNKLLAMLKEQVQEISFRLKQEQTRNLCKICLVNQINCVILNCGDRFCCYKCSQEKSICLKCQKRIDRVIKIYSV